MSGNRLAIGVVGVALLVTVGFAVGGGVVVGGDASIVFGTSPDPAEADPGEEVTVHLTANTDGDYIGTGLGEIGYTISYNPHVLTVVDVEHGDYLAGDRYDVSTDIDQGDGALTVWQGNDAREEGVTGDGVTATVTFAVDEDAPPSDVVLGYTDLSGFFASEQNARFTYAWNGTILVDGGGEEIPPTGWTPESDNGDDDGDPPNGDNGDDGTDGTDDDRNGDDQANGADDTGDDGDDGAGVITADEVDRDVEPGDDDDGEDDPPDDGTNGDDEGDPLPVPAIGSLIALFVAAWLMRREDVGAP